MLFVVQFAVLSDWVQGMPCNCRLGCVIGTMFHVPLFRNLPEARKLKRMWHIASNVARRGLNDLNEVIICADEKNPFRNYLEFFHHLSLRTSRDAERSLQDDCAAGDGLGATENYDDLGLDIPRVSKDSEKSPGERFVARNCMALASCCLLPHISRQMSTHFPALWALCSILFSQMWIA